MAVAKFKQSSEKFGMIKLPKKTIENCGMNHVAAVEKEHWKKSIKNGESKKNSKKKV